MTRRCEFYIHVTPCHVSGLANPSKRVWATLLLVPSRHSGVGSVGNGIKTERSVDVNLFYSRWSDTSERRVNVNLLYSHWSGTSVGLCNCPLFPLRSSVTVSVLRLRLDCDFHLRSFVFCQGYAFLMPSVGSSLAIVTAAVPDLRWALISGLKSLFPFCGVSTGSKARTTGV